MHLTVLLAVADLFIGTQGLGNVTPAAAYPFGLVQAGPDTSVAREQFLPNKGHCGGYQHDDRWIWRFSQTHISGTGCPSFGDFGLMPYAGDWRPEASALKMDKAQERAEPGYYAVGVENGLGVTRCEMAALAHTAVYRFTFGRAAKGAKLLVDLDWNMSRRDITNSWRRVIRDCRFERRGDTFLGGRYAWAWNDYRYHFALKVSAPVVGVTTLREPGNDRGGIYALELGDVPKGVLVVRIALSNTSPEAAEKNLAAEAPTADFDAARQASAAAWKKRLGSIELDRATDPQVRTSFETAMYRLFFQPNRQSDVGARPTYSTFSLWDTFRAAHPLYTILAPEENRDFVLSMLDQYDRQGYLPIWALGGSENHCMIGHHAVPVVVDAYLKGQLSKDEGERAFRAVKDSLTRNHRNVNDGTWGLVKEDWDILDKYGYYPFDRMRGEFEGKKVLGESVARVYECAYDDACAARLAEALGHAEDAAFFKKRSGNWRNVFDASIGYARGKDSQGRWREPFNRYDCGKGPWFDNDFCEGGSCQYTWHVMQDPEGLVAALGGKAKAGARLDLLFNDKTPDKNDRGFNYDIAGCIGQYVHGNEPSHHIAYLYAYTDRPENVGPIVRQIFDTKYGTTPDGLCGNDDCGQMSAWYVFSALGFYPMDPCGGTYVLGAPQVPGARMRLPNGKVFAVVVKGLAKDNTCVKAVTLNGKPLVGRTIRHADILAGGELVFEMGAPAARTPAPPAKNLVSDGAFDGANDAVPAAFRNANLDREDGRFELFTEDLTWNKCGKLVAGQIVTGRSQGMDVQVSSALVKIGGTKERPGMPVEPGTDYAYSFDAKSDKISRVLFNVNEYEIVDGKERVKTRCLAGPGRGCLCRSKEWKNFSGIYRTSRKAVRVELTLQLWTMTGGRADADKNFLPGDFVLIDNVSFAKDERFAKLQALLANPPAPLVVAPFSPMADPACPFLPVELTAPPTQIVFRAGVNEQKPLPVAIGNFSDSFQQYRVVLETFPKPPLDNGEFGLEGFPAEKIAQREALRFRDTDAAPESVRLDPLVEMNGAKVISVPPKEAGAVWFDFDTRGVKPGVYRGRLRVIPLGLGAEYKWVARSHYVPVRTSEVVLPVTLTVDPIVLSREAVRPAHLCSPCQSEQGFELECDLGGSILALDTGLFRPEAVGNRESAFHKTIADYLAWGKKRGVDLTFFIKYNAYGVSQALFNTTAMTRFDKCGTPQAEFRNDPAFQAAARAAWEKYVHLVAKLMDEAGVPFERYYVLVQDEPSYENLHWAHEAQAQLKALYPQMRTYVSCGSRIRGPVHFLDILGDNTDLWMIGEDTYNRPDEIARFKKIRAERGVVLATYRCKTWMKAPLSSYFRRNAWRGEWLDFDSDMFYQFNIFNRGVRGEMGFKFVPQGELAYKADGRFFPSVRYMAYREGVTDVKYLAALRAKRGAEPSVAAFLKKAAEEVMVGDPEGPELPAEKREAARQLLLP